MGFIGLVVTTYSSYQIAYFLLKPVGANRILLEKHCKTVRTTLSFTFSKGQQYHFYNVTKNEDIEPWESKDTEVSRPKIGIPLPVIRNNVAKVTS